MYCQLTLPLINSNDFLVQQLLNVSLLYHNFIDLRRIVSIFYFLNLQYNDLSLNHKTWTSQCIFIWCKVFQNRRIFHFKIKITAKIVIDKTWKTLSIKNDNISWIHTNDTWSNYLGSRLSNELSKKIDKFSTVIMTS